MSPEQERQLEQEIDVALKALPELKAPQTLLLRVRAALEQGARLPWYRQSWLYWPLAVRWAVIGLLVTLFAGLCAGSWFVPQTSEYSSAVHRASGWFAIVNTLWSALNMLLTALVLMFKQLGTAVLLGCLGAVALAWVLCFGLGTACLRLAFAGRSSGPQQRE